ncbi:MAG: AAA family ATPase, partial [Ruminococcus sp.]|nr:AAA family ATPase [Candidatus Copronaster equi]
TEAIKLVNNYNIFVLCDQKPENNPSELLSLSATEDIIKSVRQEFDYIIIDTPPASLVTDTSVIAAMSDAAIVVVREDFAPLSRVRMSIEDIDSNGSEILGCIYNMDSSTGVKRTKYGRYKYGRYNKYYGYGKYSRYSYGSYGYGYDYGATTSTKKKKK